jgi:hypothetical protein
MLMGIIKCTETPEEADCWSAADEKKLLSGMCVDTSRFVDQI